MAASFCITKCSRFFIYREKMISRDLHTLSEQRRADSFVAAEECSEMGLVLETKPVGYLLDSEAGGGKQRLRLQENVLVEPRANRLASRFFDNIGQIFGRDAQLLRIPRYILVQDAILLHKAKEICRQLLGT